MLSKDVQEVQHYLSVRTIAQQTAISDLTQALLKKKNRNTCTFNGLTLSASRTEVLVNNFRLSVQSRENFSRQQSWKFFYQIHSLLEEKNKQGY